MADTKEYKESLLQMTEQFFDELANFVHRNAVESTRSEIVNDFIENVHPLLMKIREKKDLRKGK
jgi:hypothetical protein